MEYVPVKPLPSSGLLNNSGGEEGAVHAWIIYTTQNEKEWMI
jgi:hypothetical protein